MNPNEKSGPGEKGDSCVDGLSRREFIKAILNRGSVAGVLLVSASAINPFKPAPAFASGRDKSFGFPESLVPFPPFPGGPNPESTNIFESRPWPHHF